MKLKNLILGVLPLLFAACSNGVVDDAKEMQTVNFSVNIYDVEQMSSAATRATTVTDLRYLAMGVYDISTNKLVSEAVIQDKSMENYGQFSATLPKGSYRFVFLGYDTSKAIQMQNANNISWDGQAVNNTFLKSVVITLGNDPVVESIVMERCVSMFSLVITGDIPKNLESAKFEMQGGGSFLNASTGFCSGEATRTYTIPNLNKLDTSEGLTLNFYAFLPAKESVATIKATAYDLEGNPLRDRTFESVPMQLNTRTRYTGKFFSDAPQNSSFQLELKDSVWTERNLFFDFSN